MSRMAVTPGKAVAMAAAKASVAPVWWSALRGGPPPRFPAPGGAAFSDMAPPSHPLPTPAVGRPLFRGRGSTNPGPIISDP